MLALYQKQNLKIEDLYKAKDYLSTFIKFNAKLQERDIMKYHSLQELFTSIEPFIQNPQQAATKSEEIRNIKEGAEKVYEDNKWLVGKYSNFSSIMRKDSDKEKHIQLY